MNKVFREIKRKIEFFSTSELDFPAHVHEDIELVYVKSGEGTVICDGKQYLLKERTFFLAFPNQVHRYVGFQGEFVLLVIKPSMLLGNRDAFLQGYPSSSVWHFEEGEDDHTVALLEMALYEMEQNGHGTVVDALLTAFFEKLLRFYKIEKGKISSNTVLQILHYCAEHYREEITVAEVANDLQISKSTVSHIFSTRLSINFCDHINSLRLADAVRLLKGDNYSITEISTLSGFPTTRTFNRVFQKQYGISPSDYRKKARDTVPLKIEAS